MKVHQRRLLAASAGRLAKPKLSHAVAHWRNDWEAELSMRAKESQKAKLAKEGKRMTDLESELLKVKKELAEARKAMAEGRGMEAEMQRRYDEQLEMERAKRVEHLAQVGVRRMFQQGLAKGWTAWHDLWAEKVRQTNLLKASAGRLARPKLAHAVSHWKRDWENIELAKAQMTAEGRYAAEKAARGGGGCSVTFEY